MKPITIMISLLILASLILAGFSYAQAVPLLPEFFYGQVTLNGEDAASGSVIIARIDGETRGRITLDEDGNYGEETGDDKLAVLGDKEDLGAEIQFFLKVPGMQEIASQETAEWQTAEMIRLDLTFVGDLVAQPDADTGDGDTGDGTDGSDGSSGGGGSGSSSGSGSSGSSSGSRSSGSSSSGSGSLGTVQESVFHYDRLEGGKQVDMKITNPDIPISRIQLVLFNTVEDVEISVRLLEQEQVADDLDDNRIEVYRYLSIDAPKIARDNIKAAVLSFYIQNGWFEIHDPKTVRLMHYGIIWDSLETVPDGSGADAANHYYRAALTSFSTFAIASETYAPVASKQAVEEDVVTPPQMLDEVETEDKDVSKLTGFAAADEPAGKSDIIALITFAVTILLLALVLIGIGIFRNKSKKK